MAEKLDLQHRAPDLAELGEKKIREIAEDTTRKEILSKYPGAEEIADLIIKLGFVGEKIADKIKERNDKQAFATADYNPKLEKVISDLNKDLGELIAEEDAINKSISDIWLDKKIDGSANYPELKKWVEELRDIADQSKRSLIEKFSDN